MLVAWIIKLNKQDSQLTIGSTIINMFLLKTFENLDNTLTTQTNSNIAFVFKNKEKHENCKQRYGKLAWK